MFQSKATPEVVGRATLLAQKMKNYKVLTFMFFMDDLLKIVSNLSLQFQKKGATCLDFRYSLQAAILDLIQLRQAPGSKLQELLDNIDHRDNRVYYKNTEVNNMLHLITHLIKVSLMLCKTKLLVDLKTQMTQQKLFYRQHKSLTPVTGL